MKKYKITDIQMEIFGLYYINSEDENIYILSISFDKDYLVNLSKKHLDNNDLINSWIKPLNILEITKLSFIEKLFNIIKFNKNNIDYKIIENKKVNTYNGYNFYCYQTIKNNNDNFTIIQNILISNKNINNNTINKYLVNNGQIFTHKIRFDKFYYESIGNNTFI